MNKEEFKKDILGLLNEGFIETKLIAQKDTIEKLIDDKEMIDYFYNGFNDNYEILYGNDFSNRYMKLQDFIHRLDLLCGLIPSNNLAEIKATIIDGSFDLYSAVNYNDLDDRAIIEDFVFGVTI